MQKGLKVNGKDFFSIGGQVNNSSNYNKEDIIRSFEIAKKLGLNTIAVPFYWDQIEIEEDKYNTSSIDLVLKLCRENNLKLCLIWFGTYKNGASTHAPKYIKENPEKYWPIYTTNGHLSATLSPLCNETCLRDRKAFEQLLLKAKQLDKDHNIIAIQVENEAGSLGAARDYSQRGNEAFAKPVNKDLIEMIKELKDDCPILRYFNQNGRKENASWGETFGFYAPDIFMAYHLSKYINEVASKAKELFDVPTYINVWTFDNGDLIPGLSYPSGGATKNAIEIYKHFAKNIDFIAPDVYASSLDVFEAQALPYAREDNNFFIPESFPSDHQYPIILKMIKEHHLSGIHCFGIDTLLNENNELNETAQKYKRVVDILNSSKTLLEKGLQNDNFIAVYQMYNEPFKVYEMGDYLIKIMFFNANDRYIAHVDAKHRKESLFEKKPLGFIFQGEDKQTFYITGQGFCVRFTKKESVEQVTDSLLLDLAHNKNAFHQFIDVCEGTYNEKGFVCLRKRNGDEIDYGVWTDNDIGVTRVRFCK